MAEHYQPKITEKDGLFFHDGVYVPEDCIDVCEVAQCCAICKERCKDICNDDTCENHGGVGL